MQQDILTQFGASAQKLLQNPAALCNMVRRHVLAAGDVLLSYHEDAFALDVEKKSDGSPVSQADIEAENILTQGLAALLPGVPVVAEEAYARGEAPDLRDGHFFWLVDALDGTKAYLEGEADYTVNAALIAGERPVMGVIYAPSVGTLYAGFQNTLTAAESSSGTAFRWRADTDAEKEIFVRTPPAAGFTVIAGLREHDAARLESFLREIKVGKMLRRSSSLKICAIAEGKADLYPRFGRTYAWDIAAGEAILRAAGGELTDFSGEKIPYRALAQRDPAFGNPDFLASSHAFFALADVKTA